MWNNLGTYRGRAKYSEVAARGTPVFFRGNLSENLKTPQNIFALPRYVLMLFPTVRPRY